MSDGSRSEGTEEEKIGEPGEEGGEMREDRDGRMIRVARDR